MPPSKPKVVIASVRIHWFVLDRPRATELQHDSECSLQDVRSFDSTGDVLEVHLPSTREMAVNCAARQTACHCGWPSGRGSGVRRVWRHRGKAVACCLEAMPVPPEIVANRPAVLEDGHRPSSDAT